MLCLINGSIKTSKIVNFVHKIYKYNEIAECNIAFFYAVKQYSRNNDLVERTNK